MKYNKVVDGIFVKRPNRFIAHVLINDKEEKVHVRNTGRCKELLIPGAKVILEDCSNNPNRKTKYSLIAVWKEDILVNMDSQIPNKVIFNSLEANQINGLEDLKQVKREVTFGQSRYDLYFKSQFEQGFIEVKGVTLENNGIAMFPDAPTERGTKHVLEMVEAVKKGYKGIIFFLIQMKGPKVFRLNWKMDKKFSEAVVFAKEKGVEILAYDSHVTENTIILGQPIKLDLFNQDPLF